MRAMELGLELGLLHLRDILDVISEDREGSKCGVEDKLSSTRLSSTEQCALLI